MKQYSVVDIFCGVGGLTNGFVREGFKVLAGIDADNSCKFAYEKNNQATFINKKIEEVTKQEILNLYPQNDIKILVGCAPCQPFSSYTKKKQSEDEKWKLLGKFAELILEVQPQIVSMENVPDLIKYDDGSVFNGFVRKLEEANYTVSYFIVYCPDYGIPQKRNRLVLFASKLGRVDLIDKTHKPEVYKTVKDAIYDLPRIEAGEECETDPLHKSSGLAEINLRRIKASVPGGTWRDWVEELRAECHKKATGESYDSVYGRMVWEEPAPTLTTQCNGYGNGRFGHPEQDRAISMREAALLQTFPSDYEFIEPNKKWQIEKIARHIGNAVPVELGQVIAKSISKHLEVKGEF